MYQSIKMVSSSKNSSKMIPCIICKKNYKTKANLKEHIQNIHRRDDQDLEVFYCRFWRCNKSFLDQEKFKFHLKTIHNVRESAKCNICGKYFGCFRKKNRHIRNVHKSFDFEVECKSCLKRFSTLTALKAHMRKLNHKQIRCKICVNHLGFYNKEEFKEHLNLVHKGKFCSKQFYKMPKETNHEIPTFHRHTKST